MVLFADLPPGGGVGFYLCRDDDLLDDDCEVLGEEFSFFPAVSFSFSAGLPRCAPCLSGLWQGLGLSQRRAVEVQVELVRVEALGALAEEPLLQPRYDLVFARDLGFRGGESTLGPGEFGLQLAEPGDDFLEVGLAIFRHAPHHTEMPVRRTRNVSVMRSFLSNVSRARTTA